MSLRLLLWSFGYIFSFHLVKQTVLYFYLWQTSDFKGLSTVLHKIVSFLNAEGHIAIVEGRIAIVEGHIAIVDGHNAIAEGHIAIAEARIAIAKFNSL